MESRKLSSQTTSEVLSEVCVRLTIRSAAFPPPPGSPPSVTPPSLVCESGSGSLSTLRLPASTHNPRSSTRSWSRRSLMYELSLSFVFTRSKPLELSR